MISSQEKLELTEFTLLSRVLEKLNMSPSTKIGNAVGTLWARFEAKRIPNFCSGLK